MNVLIKYKMIDKTEVFEFSTNGTVQLIGNTRIVSFVEKSVLRPNTTILINESQIVVYRFGSMNSVSSFMLDKTTFISIDTDFGKSLQIKVNTKILESDDEHIYVVYQTELDIEEQSLHKLYISFCKD